MATHPPFPLLIDKVIAGGIGLGRRGDGKVVLVPGALPGEELLVTPQKVRTDFIAAAIKEIRTPSPVRVAPPCRYADQCGGCDLLHAAPAAQLQLKVGMLTDLLARTVGIPGDLGPAMAAPVAAPQPFGYRQRIRLHADDQGRLGFRRSRSHEVVAITECMLARPEINRVLACLSQLPAAAKFRERLKGIEILASPADNAVVLLCHGRSKPGRAILALASEICSACPPVKSIYFQAPDSNRLGPISGGTAAENAGLVLIDLPPQATGERPLRFALEPGAFCQVNPEQNQRLVRAVVDLAVAAGVRTAVDLFCGIGNFSLPLALHLPEVLAFDMQRAAIRAAIRTAAESGIVNCRCERAAADEALELLIAGGSRPDLVILDPPRAGCGPLVSRLQSLGPQKLIYISCQPPTLARDLGRLQQAGYAIRLLQPFDMFPQTHHLEVLALLERQGR